jgi:hypothetical protein
MRRWVFIAALSAALLGIPLWGQRGGRGGMAMGGGRGGYAGAPHGGAYWGGGFHGGHGHGPYGYPGHYPYHPGHYPHYPSRYPWGWGYRGGYGYGWYGYPSASWGWYGGVGWSGAYDSYPATQYPVDVYAYPDNANATVAYDQQQEIDRLNDEVARLRAEREPGSANPVPQPPPKAQIRAATVLVFRNHHTEEIQDYAIVGKTLWVFTEQRARKIPIAELDVPATTKANEDRGIDFRLPK